MFCVCPSVVEYSVCCSNTNQTSELPFNSVAETRYRQTFNIPGWNRRCVFVWTQALSVFECMSLFTSHVMNYSGHSKTLTSNDLLQNQMRMSKSSLYKTNSRFISIFDGVDFQIRKTMPHGMPNLDLMFTFKKPIWISKYWLYVQPQLVITRIFRAIFVVLACHPQS